MSQLKFLTNAPIPTPDRTVGIAFPLLTIPSKISINLPPASIAPLRKSDESKSFDSSSNFAFVKSIDACTDFAYSSFSLRADPSAFVASS